MRTTNSKPRQTPLSRDTRKSAPLTTKHRTVEKQTRPAEVQASAEMGTPKVSRVRKARRGVPLADVPRIKTWLKYGLNMAQDASVYGADEDQMRNTVAANRKPNI